MQSKLILNQVTHNIISLINMAENNKEMQWRIRDPNTKEVKYFNLSML